MFQEHQAILIKNEVQGLSKERSVGQILIKTKVGISLSLAPAGGAWRKSDIFDPQSVGNSF